MKNAFVSRDSRETRETRENREYIGNRTTRKVKQGNVEIDYEQCSLVVNFEVETVC